MFKKAFRIFSFCWLALPAFQVGAALPPNAVLARDTLDSWGVNAPSPKYAPEVVADKLNIIGVRHLRTHLVTGRNSRLAELAAIQAQMAGKGYIKPVKFQDLVIAYNNDAGNTWDFQKPFILEAAASGLLEAVEGPNEMNNYWTGNGTHGVNNAKDQTKNWAGPKGNMFQWARAIKSWVRGLKGRDAVAMAGVKIVAPCLASGLSDDYAKLPNLKGLVDYGNVHYYSGAVAQPGLSQSLENPGVGYFANIYRWCQAAQFPGGPLFVSECGAPTHTKGYTLHAQAAYILNQMHDAAGIGARRFFIYTMFDPNSSDAANNEACFGIFKTDTTEKPIAKAMGALKHLLSLNLEFDDPANLNDASSFTPGYDASQLSVSGITRYSSRVSDAVVYLKSDGSTLISISHQPPMTDGNNHDAAPEPVTATVNFGGTQAWRLYDVLGVKPLEPIAHGVGSSIRVVLNGYPMYLLLDPALK